MFGERDIWDCTSLHYELIRIKPVCQKHMFLAITYFADTLHYNITISFPVDIQCSLTFLV